MTGKTTEQDAHSRHDSRADQHANGHDHSHTHEQRTRWVVYMTAVTMALEITFGYWTHSMALLADGWHMASHVFALGLTWIAYVMARKLTVTGPFSFNKKKLLALSGFASAVILQIIAVLMAVESADRFMHPMTIKFNEAIYVAVIGLAVNGLSAFFLHHNYEHHDHNIRSAYLHVMADGLTSVSAIMALLAGKYFNLYSLDSISGIFSSIVITKWAISLMIGSGKVLIDYEQKVNNPAAGTGK